MLRARIRVSGWLLSKTMPQPDRGRKDPASRCQSGSTSAFALPRPPTGQILATRSASATSRVVSSQSWRMRPRPSRTISVVVTADRRGGSRRAPCRGRGLARRTAERQPQQEGACPRPPALSAVTRAAERSSRAPRVPDHAEHACLRRITGRFHSIVHRHEHSMRSSPLYDVRTACGPRA